MPIFWKLIPGSCIGEGAEATIWKGECGRRKIGVKIGRHPSVWRDLPSLSKVRSPFVLPVLDAGILSEPEAAMLRSSGVDTCLGAPFRLLPLARSDLQMLWDTQLPDWPLFSSLMDDLLRGLIAMHLVGVVHGDISPKNLLVGPGSRLLLNDLGSRRGTPGFESPLQVEEGPSISTDLHGVGAVAWHLLCGGFWYEDDFNPAIPVPEGLHAWMERLLQREPLLEGPRFRDAAEARQALLALGGVPSRPVPRQQFRPLGWGAPCTPPMVGRQGLQAELRCARHLAVGATQVLALYGLPGAGSTRLALECLREAAEEGWEVQVAHGEDLKDFIAQVSVQPVGQSPEALRDALVQRSTRRPLALLIDRGLEYGPALQLAKLLQKLSLPLLLLLTGSPERMYAAQREAWERSGLPALHVPPLPRSELERVLSGALPTMFEGVTTRAGGLPGVALALGRALAVGGSPTLPEDLQELWSASLHLLVPTTTDREVLRMLAITPSPVPRALWARVCGGELNPLYAGLLRAGLLSETNVGNRIMVHIVWPLVAELLAEEATTVDHQRWVDMLRGENEATAVALRRLGWHLLGTGAFWEAASYLARASADALRRSDYAGAISALDMAAPALANATPKLQAQASYLRIRAAYGLATRQEDLDSVDRAARSLVDLASREGDRRFLALGLGYRGMVARKRQDPWVARAMLGLATESIGEENGAESVRLLSNLTDVLRILGEQPLAVAMGQRAVAKAKELPQDGVDAEEMQHAWADAHRALGNAQVAAGDLKGARETLKCSAEGFGSLGNLFGLGDTANALGVIARKEARVEDAKDWFTKAAEALERIGAPNRTLPLLNLGMLAAEVGDPIAMEEHFRKALAGASASLKSIARLGICAALGLQGSQSMLQLWGALRGADFGSPEPDLACLLEICGKGLQPFDQIAGDEAIQASAVMWDRLGIPEGERKCCS